MNKFKIIKKVLFFCVYTIIVFEIGKMTILSRMMDAGSMAHKTNNSDLGIALYLKVLDLDDTITKLQAKAAKDYLINNYSRFMYNQCISRKSVLDSINHLNRNDRIDLLSLIVENCNKSSSHCDNNADFWEKALELAHDDNS